jgi:uncharacterized C2H2 Zn-finger protein
MDPERRAVLVKRRAVIKAELTRTQTYIENHENKFHELKVGRDKLADKQLNKNWNAMTTQITQLIMNNLIINIIMFK